MSSPLLKPRWLIGHVLVVLFAAGFIVLGFWQLARHDDQRRANARLERALAEAPAALGGLEGDPADAKDRRVTVTGTYDYTSQLEQRPRSRNGTLGYNQVIPLVADVGVVLVNRGFLPDDSEPVAGVPQFEGTITVTGTVRPSQGRSAFGPQNSDEGALTTIARIDIDRLNSQFEGALYPVYLDLISEAPDPGGLPTVVPEPPSPSNRPNLLYAIQWFLFAAIAGVGWVLYLRKQFFTR